LIRVRPCCFSRTAKLSLLFKKAGKDVWHALLSFQGTGPRTHRRGAVPPAPSNQPSEDGKISIRKVIPPVKLFLPFSPPDRRAPDVARESLKDREPLRGRGI
jgi:hypothetical protein